MRRTSAFVAEIGTVRFRKKSGLCFFVNMNSELKKKKKKKEKKEKEEKEKKEKAEEENHFAHFTDFCIIGFDILGLLYYRCA